MHTPPPRSPRQTAANTTRRAGQALIEMAIAAGVLAMLFMAAVDAGLAYKSYQTLMNATAEAASVVAQNPLDYCAGCSVTVQKQNADTIARNAFRNEQAGTRIGTSATPDGWIEIREADSTQITLGSDSFALAAASTFTGTLLPDCQNRKRFTTLGQQCFAVVRAQAVYEPFMLTPFFGQQMTIRAIAVKPIVGNPF